MIGARAHPETVFAFHRVERRHPHGLAAVMVDHTASFAVGVSDVEFALSEGVVHNLDAC